ncbi:MAG: hypothetical protein ACLVJ6_04905 [Merdibacter sp.]
MTEVEIAKSFGMNTTQLRSEQKLATGAAARIRRFARASFTDKGWSNTAIAERMGRNESSGATC